MIIERDLFKVGDIIEIEWDSYKLILRIIEIDPNSITMIILMANYEYKQITRNRIAKPIRFNYMLDYQLKSIKKL